MLWDREGEMTHSALGTWGGFKVKSEIRLEKEPDFAVVEEQGGDCLLS